MLIRLNSDRLDKLCRRINYYISLLDYKDRIEMEEYNNLFNEADKIALSLNRSKRFNKIMTI